MKEGLRSSSPSVSSSAVSVGSVEKECNDTAPTLNIPVNCRTSNCLHIKRDIHFQYFCLIITETDQFAFIAQNICVKLKLSIWFYVSQILFINLVYNRKEGKNYLIFLMNIDLNSTEVYS